MSGPDTSKPLSCDDLLSCEEMIHRARLYPEGILSAADITAMQSHMAKCPSCAEQSATVRGLRRSLRSLPGRSAPAHLRSHLQVLGSREAARRRSTRTARERWRSWLLDFKLWTDNLMRPLAIPTAGGFFSALFLFSVFASGITIPSVPGSADVPTGLYTEASVKSCLPLGFDGSDLVVELTINDQGRVIDYRLPNLPHAASRELLRNIENHLLFTQFTPATTFGQPTAGKVRLSFRSSRIDVKG